MEWFTASFPGAPAAEIVDGVRVVRRGKQWTVHLRAFQHYGGDLRGRFDLVIDEVNTIPFFTPIWARIPVFMMIWQLAREVWWYESPFPLSAVGYALEPLYLRVYRSSRVLTFSASTAADLARLGFRGEISVLPVGIRESRGADVPKSSEPTFIYVGRLAPSKRVGEILEAFAQFRRAYGGGRLDLVGDGTAAYLSSLRSLATRLHITDAVTFCGWLDGDAKLRRMTAAHALVMASAREGWGLVVTECNACGTPAVVYDVAGLRDSVRHLETGLVVPAQPSSLADGMLQLITDQTLYNRLREAALLWSQTLTYDTGVSAMRQTFAEHLV